MDSVNAMTEAVQTAANTSTTSNTKGIMDKDDFLMLFMESLKNQDPMDPMDNTAMMQQLSQLGQMEAVANLQITVEKMQESLLGNKISESANLLGKTVVAIDSAGQKVVGTPTAYRLNNGLVEYLIGKNVVNIGQIQEVGLATPVAETPPVTPSPPIDGDNKEEVTPGDAIPEKEKE